ncbi:U3 small nucleolar ribonucleoprotein MPP10-like [Panicum miliaceum]|uniref:U3 small nucleolar ribonucleoprotein protein MPP10 n=1 Tax=Panicum miliaceum TaxID=4540 RepID=A0A3L6QCK7_PANMI|nr:U3 small nucleolar ribonucleoprotein MPP10-like [Panicum miliaceum]
MNLSTDFFRDESPNTCETAFAHREAEEKGESALQLLRDAGPDLFLSPSTDLAAAARTASQHIYSSLAPLSPAQPPPLPTLLVDAAFDAEQIWSQIELLARPILPHLRRQLRHLEQQPPSEPQAALPVEAVADAEEQSEDSEMDGLRELEEIDDDDDDDDDLGDDDDLDDDEEEEEEEERRGGNLKGLEDQFLKIDEMAEFLDKGDEEEYGGGANQGEKKATKNWMEESDDEGEDRDEDDDEGEDDDDEGQLDLEDFEDDGEEGEGEDGGGIMYKDFFMKGHNQQVKRRDGSTKKVQFKDEPHETELGGSEISDGNEEQGLSTHEKERLKMHAKIEQMEKANLEPGTWTMLGEVTASSRPKNSALEVDLDFEHNVRPAPVITEEITASLEEMIKKRIAEGHFDDVEKPSLIPSKAPKEHKELDESKSKKGLAELYEDDYAQKSGIAPAPLSISDELKKEANTLFKRICLKLDALSHFHFAPKPVIEDMSVQANVPALAMEEIAPVAVSDVAMLAPEEIFEGKGDIKEEGELTQAERKRRRANKKRRYAGSHKERPAKLQKD